MLMALCSKCVLEQKGLHIALKEVGLSFRSFAVLAGIPGTLCASVVTPFTECKSQMHLDMCMTLKRPLMTGQLRDLIAA